MDAHILLVEDDPSIREVTALGLRAAGFTVTTAADGHEGLERWRAGAPDLVLLDVMLPRLDGLEVCRAIRRESTTPVVMLTARGDTIDVVVGLESGADDYVVKPFVLREVEARLKALARRASGQSRQQRLQVADLAFDTGTLQVRRGERVIELPPIPLRILELLMRTSPHVVTRGQIERTIWGDSPPDSDALRAHMHVLRSAIDKPAEKPLLHTHRGHGWQLADTDAPAP